MTTIAYDGKTLAADSRATAGGMPFETAKAYKLKDGRLFAGSGTADDCEAVLCWLECGGDKPTLKDFVGILIEDGQCFRIEDKLMKMAVLNHFHAVGSGRDYAIAAMHYGKTAREAVELACLYDIYTAGPVTELTVDRPESAQICKFPSSVSQSLRTGLSGESQTQGSRTALRVIAERIGG